MPSLSKMCYILLVWLCLTTIASSTCSETTRTRKPWHSLSNDEQMLYVDGFQELRRLDKLSEFKESHTFATQKDRYNIHSTAQNLYWHSYWLFELENSFRDLGGRFECFTLPYWDVTNDSSTWYGMEEPKHVNQLPIYNSNLGNDGNITSDYCVEVSPWTINQYSTDDLCTDDEATGHCCLKRAHFDNATMANATRFSDAVFVDPFYHQHKEFLTEINQLHEEVHNFFASKHGTHFNTEAGDQTSDPLFPLFHSFLEYLRLLHEDCLQLDLIPSDKLDDYIPYSYSNESNITLDFPMDFSCLCNDGTERLCSANIITPRFMYDMSPNRGFSLVYELGSFWNSNPELSSRCASYLNATWWVGMDTDIDADMESLLVAEDEKNRFEIAVQSDLVTRIGVIVFAMIGVAVILRECGRSGRDKKRDLEEDGGNRVYGAI